MTKTTKATRKTPSTRRITTTTYEAVSNNIYYDGSSYRVRVSVKGVKHSKNFPSKRAAVVYRNQLMKG
jgi:hypothetical protein